MADAPLVGYRIWRYFDESNPGLYPSGMFYNAGAWTGGVNTAECMYQKPAWASIGNMYGNFSFYGGRPVERTRHRAPLEKCTCGLYAYDSLATARVHRETSGWNNTHTVVGAVLLWGEVVVGKVKDRQGRDALENPGLRYRAQYARIIALGEEPGRASESAAADAGVALVPIDYLESYSREFGEQYRRDAA